MTSAVRSARSERRGRPTGMTAPRINSRLAGRLACALVVTLTLGWATTAAADGEASAASPHPADPGPGQTERIRFAPGTDNATVRGTFDPGADDRYVLRARAGQTMILSGAFGGLGVGVLAPDGSALPGGPADSITYQLPATGDYTITIGPRRSEATSYSFTVTIPAAERIRFAPGTNTASRHADLLPATAHRYVLRAVAGQTMVVHVAPLVHNITLSIFGPDGTALAEDLERRPSCFPPRATTSSSSRQRAPAARTRSRSGSTSGPPTRVFPASRGFADGHVCRKHSGSRKHSGGAGQGTVRMTRASPWPPPPHNAAAPVPPPWRRNS